MCPQHVLDELSAPYERRKDTRGPHPSLRTPSAPHTAPHAVPPPPPPPAAAAAAAWGAPLPMPPGVPGYGAGQQGGYWTTAVDLRETTRVDLREPSSAPHSHGHSHGGYGSGVGNGGGHGREHKRPKETPEGTTAPSLALIYTPCL